jgi:ankyrin repeat protein
LFPADDPPRRIEVNTSDSSGDTALHVFLWRGDEHAARELIRHGADVNAIGDMGETPLHVAVRRAEAKTLAALLGAGAQTNVSSEFGQTPDQLAKTVERLDVFKEALELARDQSRRR